MGSGADTAGAAWSLRIGRDAWFNAEAGQVDAVPDLGAISWVLGLEEVALEVKAHPVDGARVRWSPVDMVAPELTALVCDPQWTWECGWVIEVIDCESTWRPGVVGSEVRDGIIYYFYGLLQIYHPDPPGPTNEWLFDPYLNLVEGHIQYVEWKEGTRTNDPWPNCP